MSSKTMTKVIAIIMIVFVVLTLFIGIFDGVQTQDTNQQIQTWSVSDTGSVIDTVLSWS